jgi:Fe-S-cluster containining protein
MGCQRCGCCCLGAREGFAPFGNLKIRVTERDLLKEPRLRQEVEDGFLFTPCPFLMVYDDDVASCKIYQTRPQACVDYPPGCDKAVLLGYPCGLDFRM